MIRLSCFADEISPRLEDAVDVIQRLGMRYLSLRSVENVNVMELTDAQLRDIASLLGSRGIAVSSISSPIGKSPIEADARLCLEQTKRAVDIARRFNCERVRVFSFYMRREERELYRAEVMDRLCSMATIASDAGVTLMHENEAGIYGESSDRCADILSTVNSPALRAVFDPSNFVAAGERPFDESLPRLREYIDYMHIKDSRRADGVIVPAGQGDAQLKDILPLFADSGMFFTLEPHLMVAGRDRGFSGAELFERAFDAFSGLLAACNIEWE